MVGLTDLKDKWHIVALTEHNHCVDVDSKATPQWVRWDDSCPTNSLPWSLKKRFVRASCMWETTEQIKACERCLVLAEMTGTGLVCGLSLALCHSGAPGSPDTACSNLSRVK